MFEEGENAGDGDVGYGRGRRVLRPWMDWKVSSGEDLIELRDEIEPAKPIGRIHIP